MRSLLVTIVKELKLLSRDLHSVLVLFAMPAVFIVIMSLALQDQFSRGSDFRIHVALVAPHDTADAALINAISALPHLAVARVEDRRAALDQAAKDKVTAAIIVAQASKHRPIELWLSPQTDRRTGYVIESSLKGAAIMSRLDPLLAEDVGNGVGAARGGELVSVHYAYTLHGKTATPSSVQHSVPAWLIFSMFFVVIPLSTTLLAEREFGTIRRLRSMNVSAGIFFAGKILPYLLINQVQLVLMLAVGIYVVPLLGGDRLQISEASIPGLMLMSVATGFASVSYGMLIAVISGTTQLATVIGGVGNILLGAIGGIMVPKFVMPHYLQSFTNMSPMAWGLDGFLSLLLRNGGVREVLLDVALLGCFGCAMLVLAGVIFSRKDH